MLENPAMAQMMEAAFGDIVRKAVEDAVSPLIKEIEELKEQQKAVTELVEAFRTKSPILSKILGA